MIWRRLLVLDLVLAAAAFWGILRLEQSWADFDATHTPDTVQAEAEPARSIPATTPIAAVAEDWTEISVKNPFSFDRNDVSIVAPKAAPTNQPKPVLFGTMSIGNEWIAMLAPGQSGTRTSRPVKAGETMDDWQVVEIHEKSVVVTAPNGVRETIILNDPKSQVARVYERTASAAPSAAPVNVTTAPATPPPATTAAPVAATPPPQQPVTGQPTGEMLLTPFGAVPKTK